MAMGRRAVILSAVIVALAAGQAPAPGPKPTLSEWKEQQAAAAAEKEAAADKAKKMAAVNKVLELLNSLRSKVLAEGEQEATMYNEFACFCKDTTKEKNNAIAAGTDRSNVLTTEINALKTDRDTLDTKIQEFTKDIQDAEAERKSLQTTRAADLKEYESNEEDLSMAIKSLEDAIAALKASKVPSASLLESVKKAAMTAEALGVGSSSRVQRAMAFLQEAPEVPMENYKFHSDDIIGTLEGLLDDFRKEKVDVDAAEVKSVDAFNTAMQNEQDLIEERTVQLADAREKRQDRIADIQEHSQELTTVKANLRDDQEYLAELTDMCAHRARTWDQRSVLRQGEIEVLTQAIAIISSTVSEKTIAQTARLVQTGAVKKAMTAKQAAAAPALVQAHSSTRRLRVAKRHAAAPQEAFVQGAARATEGGAGEPGRAAVVDLLKSSGSKLKSSMLVALANQIAADPFAKVKQLIQELLERLLQEAQNEGNQKGWCDKSIKASEQKRDYAGKAVLAINGAMEKLEAEMAELKEQISELEDAIAELNSRRTEAENQRAADHTENMDTISTSQAGLSAVKEAIDILSRFYKTAAVEGDVSMVQKQTPLEDAPDSGFAGGEQYTGSQGEAWGILSMLEVIEADFVRTISETEKAEAQAAKDHYDFMTETGKSLAEKIEAVKQNRKLYNDASAKYDAKSDQLAEQMALVKTAVLELNELKPVCVKTGMTYADRVANREEEIAALRKALCILGNYQAYGPEGAVGDC